MEDARHAAAQHVDRCDERQAQAAGLAPAPELIERARIPPHLADREGGTSAGLELQLEQLRQEVGLECLERVDRAAAGEVDAVPGSIAQQLEESHRVDVEDRSGAAAIALLREVAGQGQHVGEPRAGKAIGERLQRGPIALSAGDVDEHLPAQVMDGVTQGQGPQADVAAGIVRDGDGRDTPVRSELAGLVTQSVPGVVLEGAGPGGQLGQHEAAVVAGKGLGEGGHPASWYPDAPGPARSVRPALGSPCSPVPPLGPPGRVEREDRRLDRP